MAGIRRLLTVTVAAVAVASRSAATTVAVGARSTAADIEPWSPCRWSEHFPQGAITVRGGLQITRYQPRKNGPWKRAYLLTFSKGSRCTAQVNTREDLHMVYDEGALVEVTGIAQHGGDVAPYTIVARRVRFLRRHIP